MNERDADPPRWTASADAATPATRWLCQSFRDAGALPPHDLLRLERSWRRALVAPARPRRSRTWALVAGAFLLGSAATSVAALKTVRGLWTALGEEIGRHHGSGASANARHAERPSRWRIKARGAGEIEVALSPHGDELLVLEGPAEPAIPQDEPRAAPAGTNPPPAAARSVSLPAPAPPTTGSPDRVSAAGRAPGDSAGGGDDMGARLLGPRPAGRHLPVVTASTEPTRSLTRAAEAARAPTIAPPLPSPLPSPLPLRPPRWESDHMVRASPGAVAAARELREATSERARVDAIRRPTTAGPVPEGQALAEALRHLRIDRNPQAALRDLDLYRGFYPHGRLAAEAMLIRAEALFRTGDETRALAVLDLIALGESGRRWPALVRGELRAERDRCVEALDDFRRVAELGRPDDATERALYGQAACRARLGDIRRARADVETYLRLFPASPHRDDARRFLVESAASDVRP